MRTPYRRVLPLILPALLLPAVPPALAAPDAPATPAQVRIVTDPPGATVFCDGTVQDVTPLTLTGLTPGPHLIAAQKPGFGEVRRTVTLEAGQRMALDLKLEALTGLMIVESVPSGADLKINGAHRGQTPLLVTDLPFGRHRLVGATQGYAEREVEVVLSDRTPKRVRIELASSSARLTVTSVPEGANVTVNGILRGATPCEVDRLSAGEHELVVDAANYFPQRQTFKLDAGDAHRIHAVLKPVPATLTIVSVPQGARVSVDGVQKKEAPVVVEGLEPGAHTVRVDLDGYEPETRDVALTSAQKRTEEFQLARNSGTLEVVTEPSGVKVIVDGADRGTTTAGATEQTSLPFTVDLLAAGEHKLLLARTGFFPVEKTIAIEVNRKVTLRETLKRRFVPDTLIRIGTGPNDIREGCVSRRLSNGDVELETKPGIFVTIKAADILSVEKIEAAQPR
jgi:hypothetical protein